MRVLVTGGAGYLGSALIPKLLARGHLVRVLDAGYFGVEHLRPHYSSIELIRDDIRRVGTDVHFREQVLAGCECIIHLAAISNDQSADLDPQLTEDVNCRGTLALAEAARERGIKFLFSSSCAVYGGAEEELTEMSAVRPLSTYAKSKAEGEKMLQALSSSDWAPIILRNGTLFGQSPRMRFDVVVNIFSLQSTLHNQIGILGDGLQWRPYLHVRDCARAFVFFAERQRCRYTTYNLAHENLRVTDVADISLKLNPRVVVERVSVSEQDERNYRVATDRLHEEGFETRVSVEAGSEEMSEAIILGLVPNPESMYYRNAKWLQKLMQLCGGSYGEVVGMVEEGIASVRAVPYATV